MSSVRIYFIEPMLKSFNEPPAADVEGFFSGLMGELDRFPNETLEAAVFRFRRTRKYRTFPTIAECIEVCAQLSRPTTARGRVWVEFGSEAWRKWCEHWLDIRHVEPPVMKSENNGGQMGWYFTSQFPTGRVINPGRIPA
jgi:hypothetical protein